MRKKCFKGIAVLALSAIATTSVNVDSNLFASVVGTQSVRAAAATSLNYSVEGYASTTNLSGGGVLAESDSNYYKANTAESFLKALSTAKKNKKAAVIELTGDIALGSKEIGSALTTYKNVITASANQPLMHPTLLKTGVSQIDIKDMNNLTIYSKNGSKITHACFNISKSTNIMIRNIEFDEIWEWDEATSGDYDRNDWDYITVQNACTGIWIDHCTFYKAYDGIVDVKKASATQTTDVTISWSKFLPGEGEFFDTMMDELENNKSKYAYYNSLRTTYGMTEEQVRGYASGQKKTHLFGASDTEANIKNLRVTMANNYYKNSMDRLPRLRGGSAHVYNTIMDSSDLYTLRNTVKNSKAKSKIVSNGAISTCQASVLVQNSDINGIVNALLSGNGNSKAGYVGAMDCTYTMNAKSTEISVMDKTGEGLKLDADKFVNNLPYAAVSLKDSTTLKDTVMPYVGAGSVSMSGSDWMKTTYKTSAVQPTATPTVAPTATPTVAPTATPTVAPTVKPTATPTVAPTATPTVAPTATPTVAPTATPTVAPTATPVATAQTHNFTTNGKTSDFFTIAGSLTTSKGTTSYDGLTLTQCLKMESSTNITFKTEKDSTMTLVFNSDCNKDVEIDGKVYTVKNGILNVELAKGSHSIKKEDSNVNLYYIAIK